MARGILKFGKPVTETAQGNGIYQIAYYYLTAISFKIFGINEFAGRLPSLIAGTTLILVVYFIVKKFSDNRAALIAAFLATFSQIQLAWSTQLRPYVWLELFTLIITFLCYKSIHQKRIIDRNIVLALGFAAIAFLFHGTGLINIFLIGLVLIYQIIRYRKYIYLLSLIPLVFIVLIVMRYSFGNAIPLLFKINLNITHYLHFIVKNYMWLFIGATIGGLSLLKKNKELAILLIGFIFCIFSIAIFKINSQYVRYSLPAFPLLYILFAYGVTYLIDTVKSNINSLLRYAYIFVLVFICSFPIFDHKILLLPKYYYSINADVRENPIVDYKTAFNKIKKLIIDPKNTLIIDAWNDRVPYYLPNQTFIMFDRFNKSGQNYTDPEYGEKMVATIAEYEKEKKKYKSGIVIIENWESFESEDFKNYVRKTLKHEFDVNNLPYNDDDKWSISVYSWGI
jgi:uncharacterized membrane protein